MFTLLDTFFFANGVFKSTSLIKFIFKNKFRVANEKLTKEKRRRRRT
jgi:hypothetical protein